MKYKDSAFTAVTLAAGGELVAEIAAGVLGQDVADSIAGAPVNKEMVLSMAQSSFEKQLVEQSVEV